MEEITEERKKELLEKKGDDFSTVRLKSVLRSLNISFPANATHSDMAVLFEEWKDANKNENSSKKRKNEESNSKPSKSSSKTVEKLKEEKMEIDLPSPKSNPFQKQKEEGEEEEEEKPIKKQKKSAFALTELESSPPPSRRSTLSSPSRERTKSPARERIKSPSRERRESVQSSTPSRETNRSPSRARLSTPLSSSEVVSTPRPIYSASVSTPSSSNVVPLPSTPSTPLSSSSASYSSTAKIHPLTPFPFPASKEETREERLRRILEDDLPSSSKTVTSDFKVPSSSSYQSTVSSRPRLSLSKIKEKEEDSTTQEVETKRRTVSPSRLSLHSNSLTSSPPKERRNYLHTRQTPKATLPSSSFASPFFQASKVEEKVKEKEVVEIEYREEEVKDQDILSSKLIPFISLTFLCFLWLLLISLLCFFIYNSHFNYFCDTNAPEYVTGCIRCPQYGECHKGELKCVEGYVRQGYLCVEDPRTKELETKLLSLIRRQLSLQAGEYECGHSDVREMKLNEIMRYLDEEGFNFSNPELVRAFGRVMNSIEEDHIHLLRGDQSEGRYWSEEPLFSFECQIKMGIWNNLDKVLGLTFALVLAGYFYWEIRSWKWEKAQVHEKVMKVHQLLQQQKNAFVEGRTDSPQFIETHIRDSIFTSRSNKKKRDSIWNKVVSIIRTDSRIQTAPIEFHGEQETAWEWVAPILEQTEVEKEYN